MIIYITSVGKNYISIIKYLGDINYIDIILLIIKDCWELFYRRIIYVIDNFIPKMHNHEFKFPIWLSKELKCVIKQNKISS